MGKVTLDERDINLAMIEAGFAWYFKRYESDVAAADRALYEKAEAEAREKWRGLWAMPDAVAPWEYREGKRKEGASRSAQ